MTVEHTWETPDAITTYLSTELNALADGANKLGAAINNETSPEKFLDLELFVAAQGSARDADARVDIYLLESIDGSNYCFGDDSTDPPASALLWSFPLDAATTARYVTITTLEIPPTSFKLLVIQETGQAFAASGTTLKYRRHSEESN